MVESDEKMGLFHLRFFEMRSLRRHQALEFFKPVLHHVQLRWVRSPVPAQEWPPKAMTAES